VVARAVVGAELAVATPWSFHWGASRVSELAARAVDCGVAHLGMADTNGLWGAVPFQHACEAAGVAPLFGMRLCVEGIEAQVTALDTAGWQALCRLATRVQMALHPAKGEPTVQVARLGVGQAQQLATWLGEERERVADALASGGGFQVLSQDGDLLRALLERGYGRPGANPRAGLAVSMPLGAAGMKALEVAEALSLEAVACPQVAMATPDDFPRHRLLVAIGRNTNLARLSPDHLACAPPLVPGRPPAWLRNLRERTLDYRHHPRARELAAALAARATYRIPLGTKRMPRLALPGDPGAGFQGLGGNPCQNPQAHAALAMQELRAQCTAGIHRRELHWTDTYRAQLERELALIAQQDLADYFLIVADITRWANGQGIRNCGRGSAANSLVSYLLGFTHVDPVRHDLWFDRFLHTGRRDFPDVDLDFAWDERDRVLDQMYRRHGRAHVAMLGTHVTFGVRGAVRELAKAMGIPPAEIAPVTRALPWMRGSSDLERIFQHPKAAGLRLHDEPWATIVRQAVALDGFPRHLGVHAGGMVLAPSALTDHLPLQHAKKETEDGRVVITQWDMGPVEEAGLLKIDLLGNRGLAVVRDAQRMVRDHSGLKLRFDRIDAKQDLRTQELIARGDTMGCFYIESPSMRSLLQKLACRDYPVLVAASSIIRPGISASGMMGAYIERHREVLTTGKHQKAWYLHPRLEELFAETYGVMAYQEDVLRVAQDLAGMSAADADGLRKAMTKKGAHKRLPTWREALLAGVQASGMSAAQAQELWRQIESFAGYSFCKAHSASYAEVSFRSAYLRAHHPAEFMAAVLRNHGGFYTTFAYIAEAMRMGLKILPPCVNRGELGFEGQNRELRCGLSEVQNVRHSTLLRLMAAREDGPFISLDDFCKRVAPYEEELESLVRAGALDGLPDGYTRPERMRWVALYRRGQGELHNRLFAEPDVPRPPSSPEFPPRRILALEEQALGYLLSAHPLSLHQHAIRAAEVMPARDLPKHAGERVRLVGWQVTQKPVRTSKGEAMSFLSFEDTTALYETVLFPQAYKRLAPWTLTRGPYVLEGLARNEHGVITVEVDQLQLLRDVASSRPVG
jgi:DNA-directed DNA polymerase III PolC